MVKNVQRGLSEQGQLGMVHVPKPQTYVTCFELSGKSGRKAYYNPRAVMESAMNFLESRGWTHRGGSGDPFQNRQYRLLLLVEPKRRGLILEAGHPMDASTVSALEICIDGCLKDARVRDYDSMVYN